MKIGYWITTIIIGMETLAGGVTDLLHGRTMLIAGPSVAGIVTHLGYPLYFLTILGLWKIAGAIVIFAPGLPRLKEWAYAGVVFELTGAAASWALHDGATVELISPLALAAVAIASWALRPEGRAVNPPFRKNVTAGTLPRR